jgi:hypothetical protein
MRSRTRNLAITAGAAGALAARRRARLRRAAAGIRDAVLPTHRTDLPSDRQPGADEAHAPGHQHLPIAATDEPEPRRLRGRPWTKHGHGMRHPYAGS